MPARLSCHIQPQVDLHLDAWGPPCDGAQACTDSPTFGQSFAPAPGDTTRVTAKPRDLVPLPPLRGEMSTVYPVDSGRQR